MKRLLLFFLFLLCLSGALSATEFPKVILRGDYPDPSIIRDGKDYYMTHSPFYYTPGFLIWHSTDLMHWQPVTRAMTQVVGSAMAPDLVKHEGRYYIYFPANGTNWVIWADDIRGPWSNPIDLKVGDIDPGHIVGEDGKRYLHLSGGKIVQLSDDGLSTVGISRKVYDGWEFPVHWETEGMWLESPKLIRKDGYFYLVSAEGGTAGPPTSHMVVAARSKSVEGPWENSPYNPIVHTYNANERWWSKGHGTLIDDTDGNWWIVYHAYENGFYTLGRQTLIEPMQWLDDGWFRSRKLHTPVRGEDPSVKHEMELSDDFSKKTLGLQWSTWRDYDAKGITFRDNSLFLKGKGQTPKNARLLLVTATDKNYETQVEVSLERGGNGGLILFYDEQAFAGISSDGKQFTVYENGDKQTRLPVSGYGNHFFLKIINRKNNCTLQISKDGHNWETIRENLDVSEMHHNNYKGFYALRVGLMATGNREVKFNDFRYTPLMGYLKPYSSAVNNNKNGLHLVWSEDGKTWNKIGSEYSFLRSDYGNWETEKRLIDPSIVMGDDGLWHCYWTLNETADVMGHAATKDFINWSRQSYPPKRNIHSNGMIVVPQDVIDQVLFDVTIKERQQRERDGRGGVKAPKPVFRDPVYDGAADPIVIWNSQTEKWWMFYTNRRANQTELPGVSWVFGSPVGIAESADGAHWTYVGTATMSGLPDNFGGKDATFWAPDIVLGDDGKWHMYLSIQMGIAEQWGLPGYITHLTSTDLQNWNYESYLPQLGNHSIDADILRMPDGTWRMYYKNQHEYSRIAMAESKDLYTWSEPREVLKISGEGPITFQWKGYYWLIIDTWNGQTVFRSTDAENWERQPGDPLMPDGKGTGLDDIPNALHANVVVSNDRVYMYYFTHPGRIGEDKKKDTYEQRRTSIQVVELEFTREKWIHADRNRPTYVELLPASPVEAYVTIDITRNKKISDKLIGIFYEDLNYAADGGLYAELVQNRDFEYTPADVLGRDPEWNAGKSWELLTQGGSKASFDIDTINPIHVNNPHYAVLRVSAPGKGVGLMNSGFGGIAIKAGETYNYSLFARSLDGKPGKLTIRLTGPEGEVYGEATTENVTREWKKHTGSLVSNTDVTNAKLEVIVHKKGTLALDMISLFPQNTFKNRPNGLRADLAQTIADLNPRFVRFPGGCLAHGDGLNNMYRWKNTVGPLEARVPQSNIWRYHQTAGLGYFEFFQYCEDIGAEPIPVVAAGVCCQNSRDGGQQGLPLCEMHDYAQEILDLIEYANGDASTRWGKVRADAGHPEPFNLKYVGIGNEDLISDIFEERFTMLYRVVKEKHPEITIIGTAGPFFEGTDYEEGWEIADRLNVPVMDEHYYQTPGWFINNQDFYDAYNRKGAQVYLGEYAAHIPGRHNNIETALAEAIYMTSLERNGDIVSMASYAPLLAKEGNTQWNPDLIYFNNTEVKPTVGYYVQQLYGQNAGDIYYPSHIELSNKQDGVQKRIAVSVVRDSQTNDLILKIVNLLPVAVKPEIDLTSLGVTSSQAICTLLTGTPDDRLAKPLESTVRVTGNYRVEMPAYSFMVLRIKQ